jgi:hypothetical protein
MIIVKDAKSNLTNNASSVVTEKSSLELADQDQKRKVSVTRLVIQWIA